MMKEMNHRFGFYLVSALMIVMLAFIYFDVQGLSKDVDALLEGTQNEIQISPEMFQNRTLPESDTTMEMDNDMEGEEMMVEEDMVDDMAEVTQEM